MSRCFFSWCRNEWWGWCGSSINLISPLQKYNIFLFSQTYIAWAWKNMYFVHEYINFQVSKSYNTENPCTEIMQNFGFSFRILNSSDWKWIFICHVFKSLGKTIVQVNNMTCFWVKTLILIVNSHVIMQKDVRYSVNNFNNNNYLVVSKFIWR